MFIFFLSRRRALDLAKKMWVLLHSWVYALQIEDLSCAWPGALCIGRFGRFSIFLYYSPASDRALEASICVIGGPLES